MIEFIIVALVIMLIMAIYSGYSYFNSNLDTNGVLNDIMKSIQKTNNAANVVAQVSITANNTAAVSKQVANAAIANANSAPPIPPMPAPAPVPDVPAPAPALVPDVPASTPAPAPVPMPVYAPAVSVSTPAVANNTVVAAVVQATVDKANSDAIVAQQVVQQLTAVQQSAKLIGSIILQVDALRIKYKEADSPEMKSIIDKQIVALRNESSTIAENAVSIQIAAVTAVQDQKATDAANLAEVKAKAEDVIKYVGEMMDIIKVINVNNNEIISLVNNDMMKLINVYRSAVSNYYNLLSDMRLKQRDTSVNPQANILDNTSKFGELYQDYENINVLIAKVNSTAFDVFNYRTNVIDTKINANNKLFDEATGLAMIMGSVFERIIALSTSPATQNIASNIKSLINDMNNAVAVMKDDNTSNITRTLYNLTDTVNASYAQFTAKVTGNNKITHGRHCIDAPPYQKYDGNKDVRMGCPVGTKLNVYSARLWRPPKNIWSSRNSCTEDDLGGITLGYESPDLLNRMKTMNYIDASKPIREEGTMFNTGQIISDPTIDPAPGLTKQLDIIYGCENYVPPPVLQELTLSK